MTDKKRVLMVCLGNICRSPIAEAVFRDQINKLNLSDVWEVRSAALAPFHRNKPPDPRALSVLKENNITDYDHTVEVIKSNDFITYDYIFGMDNDNIQQLNHKKPKHYCKVKIELLGKYDPLEEIIIRDPYYDTNIDGFRKVYKQCERSIAAFLEQHKYEMEKDKAIN